MFKNIIIAVLVVVILNLLVQNKQNVDILVNDLANTKELVVKGTNYVKKTFRSEFSDVLVEATENDPFGVENNSIEEDTFFEDK